MKGLIIINSFTSSPAISYKAWRLMSEFRLKGIECDVVKTVDLPVIYKNGIEMIPDIDEWGFCVYLDKDKYLIDAIEKKMPVFNSGKSTFLCDDKMVTFQALRNSGIRTPLTIPAPLCYSQSPDQGSIDLFLDIVEKELGYPMICKESYGSLGKQVYLIKNREELEQKNKELINVTHLFQKFYSESQGRDYRVLTIGGKVVASMERINDHDFRSNIAEGGVGKPVTLSPEFIEMAERVSNILGLDYGGIDLIKGNDGKPVFIEANSNCFFSEIEKVTKINITKILVEHIISRLKDMNLI